MRAIVALLAVTAAAPAVAQVHGPYGPGWTAMDRHRYAADQHRLEMDRLRIDADRRAIEARQHQIDARLNVMAIQSARQPDIAIPLGPRPLRSLEEERAARLAATARRQDSTAAMGQIDAWLDRAPTPDR